MADAAVFDWICRQLEQATSLSDLEARGTLRVVLGEANLDASTITAAQMQAVLEHGLPQELDRCAVDDSYNVCQDLIVRLKAQQLSD